MELARFRPPPKTQREREFSIDNLLVRIHYIIVMIKWTGLAPWEFEFPFPGSLTSTFLVPKTHLTFREVDHYQCYLATATTTNRVKSRSLRGSWPVRSLDFPFLGGNLPTRKDPQVKKGLQRLAQIKTNVFGFELNCESKTFELSNVSRTVNDSHSTERSVDRKSFAKLEAL